MSRRLIERNTNEWPARHSDYQPEDENQETAENWESASGSEAEEPMDESKIKDSLRSISFGALVNSQSTLAPKPAANTAKPRVSDSRSNGSSSKMHERNPARLEAQYTKVKRESSKHAPLEMSSKKPVSRHREVIGLPSNKSRDPRFNPLITGAGSVDMTRTRQNYSFLDDYREDEMKMMRAELKKGIANESRRAEVEKKLQSMESRKLSQRKKDEEREWLLNYRKKEKEAVKEGKTPFYLKKSEVKRMMLMDKFTSLGEKQRDRVLEKKRRRKASKEKKHLPTRRAA